MERRGSVSGVVKRGKGRKRKRTALTTSMVLPIHLLTNSSISSSDTPSIVQSG